MFDYYVPQGGLPPQSQRLTDKALFTEAYAYIPAEVQTDIVTSFLPFWQGMRAWTLARPMTGFAETFSHMLIELAKGGGSEQPEVDPTAQSVVFVVQGEVDLNISDQPHTLQAGGYAYIPANVRWQIVQHGDDKAIFHWIRKRYIALEGLEHPEILITSDQAVAPVMMPETERWSTTRFVDPADMRHDMHVNIVTFAPGGVIPFNETHVMEHGLYVLCGTASYCLNQDWYEVKPGDFLWLRAFCPQACYASGDQPFRYLLYKDVNRHPAFFSGS